jgi:hypothetical protein
MSRYDDLRRMREARFAKSKPVAPSIDERVSLYLQAVHGNREFTKQERSAARNLLLNSMAAEIAATPVTKTPPKPVTINTPVTINPPISVTAKRGRPKTGKAMSGTERTRRWRQQKATAKTTPKT